DPSAMKMLHGNLVEHLQNEMGFSSKSARPKNLTPHMTVAFRDLSSENFQQAWQEFKDRSFDYVFEVNSIFLLKHDYTRWQPFYEFTFSEGQHLNTKTKVYFSEPKANLRNIKRHKAENSAMKTQNRNLDQITGLLF